MTKLWVTCLAFFLVTPPLGAATRLQIRVYAYDVRDLNLQLLADGTPLCTLRGTKVSKLSCEADLPTTAKQWHVRGSYEVLTTFGYHRKTGESRYTVLDIGPVAQRLADRSALFGERMSDFIGALQQFRKQYSSDANYPLIEKGKPATQIDFDNAKKRLGFALPADFVSLQKLTGAFSIGDHSLTAVKDIDNAYVQMRRNWGTPEEAMQTDYSAAFRKMLKESVLLFTEVGDGLGGLIYRPGPSQECAENARFYWTEQEGGTDLLKDMDGHCMDFAQAMDWIIGTFALDELADEVAQMSAPSILVDSSLAMQQVALTVDTNAESFRVEVRAHWSGPHN